MGQIKIYARDTTLARRRQAIGDGIHAALVEAFAYPAEKRFQRFFPLTDEDFVHPSDRSADYLVIEVILFPGRSVEAKKIFSRLVLRNLKTVGITANDIEIVLIESARENWTIRGVPGDELKLNYKVDV